MPADPFTLRQADQARTDFAIIEDELEAIHKRLSQLPTRNEVWRAAMLGRPRRIWAPISNVIRVLGIAEDFEPGIEASGAGLALPKSRRPSMGFAPENQVPAGP